MADSPLEEDFHTVAWALSGTYDEDRKVLIDAEDPRRSLSRREVANLVARLAGAFDRGSTVCIHSYNDIIYPVLVLSILASGCVWTGTNPAYKSAELAHHFANSGTRYVITNRELEETVEEGILASAQDVEVILLTDILSNTPPEAASGNGNTSMRLRTLHDLLSRTTEMTLQERLSQIPSDSPASVMSTSGTTGLPKMVERSHRSLIIETSRVQDNDYDKLYQIRRLYCTPIFHAFSFPEMVINSLRLGYPSYYMRRFTESFATYIHKFNITETMAVPMILLKLAERAEVDENEKSKLQTLRMVLCAGAPLGSQLRDRFLRIFDGQTLRVVQAWGMTEGGRITTFQYPEIDRTGSVGRPIQGHRIKVSDDSRVELSDGTYAGELLVQGLQSTTRYLGDADATRETFGDGWLRTGDIGYVTNGKVYLVDRKKDIIKVNGWSVSPVELENILLRMPGVLDAAAVSSGTNIEEHAAIFIVRRNLDLSTAEVMKHLFSFVARYKVATCEIHFVQSIPRNPSGKVLRRALQHSLTLNLVSQADH